ncbi:phosphotransferase enzyme family protein [Kaistella sp.]|uniref:phosphotransferase enzyme family protein n=1 Tax=Kaistella sp. TaxID=2782235 RepID=UPI00359FFBDD
MDPKIIVNQFLGSVEILSIMPIENGLINHTFLVETESGKFILQQINTFIFKNPNAIQNNHLKINEILDRSGYSKKTVKIIPTLSNDLLFEKNNKTWRMLEYLENSVTFLKPSSTEIAFEATKCLSEFYKIINQEQIILEETLPDFINFEKRVNDFKTALIQETERKKTAEKEINFILEYLSLPEKWIELQNQESLPNRVIHADPKISNILFDNENKAIAVIDLDTMMNGTILYDFGDMIRSYTNNSDEDEGSVSDNFDAENYVAVKDGFLFYLKETLTPIELENLDYAAQLITYIQAVRFLTDYLNHDIYYSVKYDLQNLDRTKNQINLLKGLQLFLN